MISPTPGPGTRPGADEGGGRRRASFGKDGLRELAAPPDAKTPVRRWRNYDAKGLKAGDKVGSVSMVDPKAECS